MQVRKGKKMKEKRKNYNSEWFEKLMEMNLKEMELDDIPMPDREIYMESNWVDYPDYVEYLESIDSKKRDCYAPEYDRGAITMDWDRLYEIIFEEKRENEYNIPGGIKEIWELNEKGEPEGKYYYNWEYIINMVEDVDGICVESTERPKDTFLCLFWYLPDICLQLIDVYHCPEEVYEYLSDFYYMTDGQTNLPDRLVNNFSAMYRIYEYVAEKDEDIGPIFYFTGKHLKSNYKFLSAISEFEVVRQSQEFIAIIIENFVYDEEKKVKMFEVYLEFCGLLENFGLLS